MRTLIKWGAVLYIVQAAAGVVVGVGLGLYCAGDISCVMQNMRFFEAPIGEFTPATLDLEAKI